MSGSHILPLLVNYHYKMLPHLGQVWNGGGEVGVTGRRPEGCNLSFRWWRASHMSTVDTYS